MAKKSTTSAKSSGTSYAKQTPSRQLVLWRRVVDKLWRVVSYPFVRWYARTRNFLSRRPHRSFRRTRRRDVAELTPLPSNIFFTSDVLGTIKRDRRSYIAFILVYTLLFTGIAGIINQESYSSFSDSVKQLGPQLAGGDIGKVGETFTLFSSVVSGQLGNQLGEAQQVFVGLLALVMWMSIVWFLRHRLGGAQVRVRDALYNSGAPIVPTFLIALVGLFQMVPGAVGVIAYFAATSTGVVAGGVESMLFAVAAILLVVLSLYWLTGTIFGLIIVTIPGTYPFRALSLAGDVVVGRRTSLLLRLLWMAFIILVLWVLILVPAILIADAQPWKWLPIVPLVTQLLVGMSIVFAASYVYLLYRRMIDAAPKQRSRKAL